MPSKPNITSVSKNPTLMWCVYKNSQPLLSFKNDSIHTLKWSLAFVQIKTYPRTIGDSVRRKEDKRSKKRREVKERKETVRCRP